MVIIMAQDRKAYIERKKSPVEELKHKTMTELKSEILKIDFRTQEKLIANLSEVFKNESEAKKAATPSELPNKIQMDLENVQAHYIEAMKFFRLDPKKAPNMVEVNKLLVEFQNKVDQQDKDPVLKEQMKNIVNHHCYILGALCHEQGKNLLNHLVTTAQSVKVTEEQQSANRPRRGNT